MCTGVIKPGTINYRYSYYFVSSNNHTAELGYNGRAFIGFPIILDIFIYIDPPGQFPTYVIYIVLTRLVFLCHVQLQIARHLILSALILSTVGIFYIRGHSNCEFQTIVYLIRCKRGYHDAW